MTSPSGAPGDDPTQLWPRGRDEDAGAQPRSAADAAGGGSAGTRSSHTLPLGTRLRDHEITGLIGEGGFGIVYLAWDHSLQRKVAIKEYMPASMASRVSGSSAIVVKSERHLDTFRAGLKSFVNEARLLARFDHPSLVKVYRFWEENGTAYMVMPFYEGPTLKAALAALGRPPSELELRRWLRPLLDALRVMHAAQCFHRDIAPDNILLTPRGPLLLDFGAARRVIGDMTHALTVVLKPGYAPIEQYGDVASMAQGAWTDLYALACVVYYAITGRTPASAVERLIDDRLEPLATTMRGRYGAGFLRAIDAALAVRPRDRPQDDEAFRRLLDADAPSPQPEEEFPPSAHSDFESTHGDVYSTLPGTLLPLLATEIIVRPAAAGDSPHPEAAEGAIAVTDIATATPPPKQPTSSWPLGIAAGFGALALGVVALVWTLAPREQESPSPTPVAASAAATRVRSTVKPAPSSPVAPAVAPLPRAAEPVEAATSAATLAPTTRPAIGSSESIPSSDIGVAAKTGAASPSQLPPTTAAATPSPRRDIAGRVRPAAQATSAAAPSDGIRALRAPTERRVNGARCSDILQKASLEPLTADEAAYLKRECR